MSSGAALSTPQEHLIKITSALTATGQMAAQARVGIADAGMAYPLGSLLAACTTFLGSTCEPCALGALAPVLLPHAAAPAPLPSRTAHPKSTPHWEDPTILEPTRPLPNPPAMHPPSPLHIEQAQAANSGRCPPHRSTIRAPPTRSNSANTSTRPTDPLCRPRSPSGLAGVPQTIPEEPLASKASSGNPGRQKSWCWSDCKQENELLHVPTIYAINKYIRCICTPRMPSQQLVDRSQRKLTTCMLIAISKIPSFGPPARLH